MHWKDGASLSLPGVGQAWNLRQRQVDLSGCHVGGSAIKKKLEDFRCLDGTCATVSFLFWKENKRTFHSVICKQTNEQNMNMFRVNDIHRGKPERVEWIRVDGFLLVWVKRYVHGRK